MKTINKIAVALAVCVTSYLPSSASAQVMLPYFEGFEGGSVGETYQVPTPSLAGAPDWSYANTDPSGRLRFNDIAGFVKTGNFAVTLDRDPSGTVQTNFLSGTLDMSNYNAANDVVLLAFSVMNHGEEVHPNDRVWVRGSSADTFIEIGNLNVLDSTTGTYVDIAELNVSGALVANGQNFSSTFQLRFGQEDNFPATGPSASDGYSFDDIQLTVLFPNDVGATAVVAPLVDQCGLSLTDVVVSVTNFGSSSQTDIPLEVTVTGDAAGVFNVIVPGPIAYNETVEMVAGQVDLFAGGEITVDAFTELVGDGDLGNDGTTGTVILKPTEIMANPVANLCLGEAGTLSLITEPNTTYSWWDAQVDGTELAQGDMLVTASVMGPTTYYAQRDTTQATLGPVDNTFAGGGNYTSLTTDGMVFDTTVPITIDTVYVYPNGAGDVVVNVLDTTDTVIDTVTITVLAADAGIKTALQVDLEVPAGTGFRMTATGTTTGGLYRNSAGAAFPYATPGGEVVITDSINNLPEFYYFFYDWEVTIGGCGDERTAVTIDADEMSCQTDLSLSKTAADTATAGEDLEYTIVVTNNGPQGAYSIVLADPGADGLTFVSNSGDCISAFPCDIGFLASGASATVTSTFRVDPSFTGTVSNTASVTTTAGETTPGDESALAMTEVSGAADLTLVMSADPNSVEQGAAVTYTVTVTNNGPSDASAVVVATTVPAEVSSSSTSGCASDPEGVPMCALGDLAVGANTQFTIAAEIAAEFSGPLSVSASASSDTEEANAGDESDSAEVEVTVRVNPDEGSSDGGCGCQAGSGKVPSQGWLALLVFAILGLRRRRHA